MNNIAPEIFKAYDIRGIVDYTLTNETAYAIGRAIAITANKLVVKSISVGRDGRLSGGKLTQSLCQGLTEGGLDVLDVGMVTTPMLYFTAHTRCHGSGVMITGSHNPPEYNGFKIMLAGDTFAGDRIQDLLHIIQNGLPEISNSHHGIITVEDNIYSSYEQYIVEHIRLARPISVIIDAGNGIAGAYAGRLLRAIGCEVQELFCDVDGTFPHHHPDPAKPENLQDIIQALRNSSAEIGLAFDGDGDRLGVVTRQGQIIWPDRQLMLFARDVLSRNPQAKVIYDVKCTRLLDPWIRQHHGEPIISKTGHSFIKSAMKQHQALVAGEMSGHLFFKDQWFGFDDGLYAGVRLLEILSHYSDISTELNQLPNALSTPELNIKMEKEGENHQFITKLQQNAQFNHAQRIINIDGLRVEYEDGFGLIRASNTTPVLVLRFEADNETALKNIQQDFKQVLNQAGINNLPF